jgi:serine protease Do
MKFPLAISTAVLAAVVSVPGAFAQARTRTIVVGNGPYLGVGVRDVDAESVKKFNLKDVRGVEITSVDEGSPAAKAGLKDGDVVLEYNGQQIEGRAQLSRMVTETPVGHTAKLGVWRNGSMQTLTATIEEKKGPTVMTGGGGFAMPDMRQFEELRNLRIPEIDIPSFSMTYQSPVLGIMGEPLSHEEQLADFFGVKDGVLVKSVTKNSAAEKAGIKAGDVIVKVDDTTISSTQNITKALRDARPKKSVTVVIVRQKKEMPVTVTVEMAGVMGSPVRAFALPGNWDRQ